MERYTILCGKGKLWKENFQHFMTCSSYGNNPLQIYGSKMFEKNMEDQVVLAKDIRRRQFLRKRKQEEDGLPPILAPMLQTSGELQ